MPPFEGPCAGGCPPLTGYGDCCWYGPPPTGQPAAPAQGAKGVLSPVCILKICDYVTSLSIVKFGCYKNPAIGVSDENLNHIMMKII